MTRELSTMADGSVQTISNDVERPVVGAWVRFSFTVVHMATAMLLRLLSLPGLYRFARMFGTIEWAINYKRRGKFAAALAQVWGRSPTADERRQTARMYFIRSRWDKLFYLIFDCIPRERAKALLRIENKPLLDDAVKRGRGVYVALSHHGAHHAIGMLMSLHGYKVAGVRDRKEGGLRRWVQERFDRKYPEFRRTKVLYADSFPRDIYRCLQDGYLLGSAMDTNRVRAVNQKTEEVEIFGERQPFLSGPLRIAIRCKCPILQAFILPDRGFGYRVVFLELLPNTQNVTDEEAVVSDTMRKYAANVEQQVRAAPWLMSRT